jgi:hypothetical protein
MTKTELQTALAEATQTDKRTAGVFLDTLSGLAYKEIKKNGEFVLPGFGKLRRYSLDRLLNFVIRPEGELTFGRPHKGPFSKIRQKGEKY